jgi:hypothetical protein
MSGFDTGIEEVKWLNKSNKVGGGLEGGWWALTQISF